MCANEGASMLCLLVYVFVHVCVNIAGFKWQISGLSFSRVSRSRTRTMCAYSHFIYLWLNSGRSFEDKNVSLFPFPGLKRNQNWFLGTLQIWPNAEYREGQYWI